MPVLDAGGKLENRKTCGSKYGLETKCTYKRRDRESNPRLCGAKRGNYRCAKSNSNLKVGKQDLSLAAVRCCGLYSATVSNFALTLSSIHPDKFRPAYPSLNPNSKLTRWISLFCSQNSVHEHKFCWMFLFLMLVC